METQNGSTETSLEVTGYRQSWGEEQLGWQWREGLVQRFKIISEVEDRTECEIEGGRT